MLRNFTSALFCLWAFIFLAFAQSSDKKTEPTPPLNPKKTNSRPAKNSSPKEPFENASIATMREQCVKLETEKGVVELELFPEIAPASVRNFLNLVAIKAFDTTTFSRVVPGFVVQGGDVGTRQESKSEFLSRSRRTIPDEPSLVKHERGILSMARTEEPNSASSHFFIVVGNASHLDGTFTAFGRVTKGMETIDAINKMTVEGDKPTNPVRLNKAAVVSCAKEIKTSQ